MVVQRTVPIVVPPERPAQIAPKVPGNAREAPHEGGQEAAPPGSTRWETLRITLVLASTDDLERASGTPQLQMGPVLDDRQKEVALVAEAYGPPVRVIPLKRAPDETRQ